MATIAGVLTIHDEAGTVARAVESFASVCDPIIGLDVGSTDGAVEIARGLGVEIHAQEWSGFTSANEEMLRLCRGRADYALIFGAIETVEQVGELPALAAPKYLLPAKHNGSVFWTDRLFDTAIDWTCPGPVHSGIQPHFIEERERLPALVITSHDDDGRRPEKLERYRRELEAWLKDHPRDARSTYYLAAEYFHLGMEHTASGLFRRRAAMEPDDEYAWHAAFMAGVCELHFDFAEGAAMLVEAYRRRPSRMEPLYILEQALHQAREQTAMPADDLLYVQPDAYLGGV